MATRKKAAKFSAWVGIVDAIPHVEHCTDTYGDYIGVQLFRKRADARKRYEAVRRVTLTVGAKS